MPRKITHPYTRETALMEDGKPILIVLNPPGYTIGFRPKHGRETYHLTMQRAYELAQQEQPSPSMPPERKQKPDMRPVIHPSELKKLRVQQQLTSAIERLVELVQHTEKIA